MPPLLAIDPPPGVDPFAAWVICGLVVAVLAEAYTIAKLAMFIANRSIEREVALGVISTKMADAMDGFADAVKAIPELGKK